MAADYELLPGSRQSLETSSAKFTNEYLRDDMLEMLEIPYGDCNTVRMNVIVQTGGCVVGPTAPNILMLPGTAKAYAPVSPLSLVRQPHPPPTQSEPPLSSLVCCCTNTPHPLHGFRVGLASVSLWQKQTSSKIGGAKFAPAR